MKRIIFLSIFIFLILFLLFGCMSLFNLSLTPGIYVAGEWNNWIPTESDKMILKGGEYQYELPVASITFLPGSQGNIGWYKVIYIGIGESKIQSSVPIWYENLLDATMVTVYASPDLMYDGYAVGAGDSEKMLGDWYCAGEFNNWNLTKMNRIGEKFVLTIDIEVNAGDSYYYKIARNTDWKPYEEQFDGKNYNAGYGQDGLFVADKAGSSIVVEYDPKYSILNAYVK